MLVKMESAGSGGGGGAIAVMNIPIRSYPSGSGALIAGTNDSSVYSLPTNAYINASTGSGTITFLKGGTYHYIITYATRGSNMTPSVTIGGNSISVTTSSGKDATEGDVTVNANDTCVITANCPSSVEMALLGITLLKT